MLVISDLGKKKLPLKGLSTMAKDSGLDDVLATIGFGYWQLPVLILTILVHVVIPIHMMGSALLNAPVEFKCLTSAPEGHNFSNATSLNLTLMPETYPFVLDEQNLTLVTYDSICLGESSDQAALSHRGAGSGGGAPSNLLASGNGSNVLINSAYLSNITAHPTGLPSCPWVTYDESVFTSTVVSEFDLICEKETLRPLYQIMYSIGPLFGSFFAGYVSDSFGRKRAVQISSLINFSSTVCMFVMPWYMGILVNRIFVGASCNALLIPSYSLALEITPPKYRTLVGMLLGTSFSVGIVNFAALGYFVRTWRYLLLLAAASPFLIIFPLALWIDESPRWLLQHGRGQEVYSILIRAARRNKAELSSTLDDVIRGIERGATTDDGSELHESKLSVWHRIQSGVHGIGAYYSSSSMRIILIIIPLLWILQCCLYLGIILNANNFTSNNPFIYMTMSGMTDFSAILVATPFSVRFGRRILMSVAFFVAGSFLMVDLIVPKEYSWIKWILVMTALMLVSASFQICFLYTPELFPTVIRARGFALASLAGNLGFLIAPLITDILYQEAWWSVSVSFGLVGILASLLVPLLPETNNRPLPETIEDVEKRHRKNKLKKQTKYDIGLPDEKDKEETEECEVLTPS